MAILGYILVMVTILADGTVTGESIDYFKDPNECFQNVLWEESGTLIPYTVSKLIVTTARVNNLDEVENWSVRWHKITVD